MKITQFVRISLIAALAASTGQTKSMLPYLTALVGDMALMAGAGSIGISEKTHNLIAKESPETAKEIRKVMSYVKPSSLSQLKKDGKRIEPYVPFLVPGGVLLSAGGRLAMLRRAPLTGIALAALSVPINAALISAGYGLRLDQAPDATIIDKAKDSSQSMKQKIQDFFSNNKNK